MLTTDVRQSAKYVLGIISAPRLAQREGLVSIPSLEEMELADPRDRISFRAQQQAKSRLQSPTNQPELDLSIPAQPTITPNSDRFMVVIIAILCLGLAVWAIG
jgi:hypothetical protein